MKVRLRRFLSRISRVPIVGRLVRIAASVWRAPATQLRLFETQARLDRLEHSNRDKLNRLLTAVTDVHHRQQTADYLTSNLARSAPIAFRRLERLRAASDERLAELEQRLEDTERRMVLSLSDTQSSLRAAIAAEAERGVTQEARLEDHAGNLTYLLERVEFVRTELMFEMRYGAASVEPTRTAQEPAVISAIPAHDLRLNLGAGHLALPGYVNIDNRELPGIDVVAEVENLPFAESSVAEIYSSHFLEHFPEERLRRRVLPYLISLLAPGAEFRAVVPDAHAMITRYAEGSFDFADLKMVIYGGQDYDGDFHFTMFTPESICSLFEYCGLTDVRVLEKARVNGKSLELEAAGRRPTGVRS